MIENPQPGSLAWCSARLKNAAFIYEGLRARQAKTTLELTVAEREFEEATEAVNAWLVLMRNAAAIAKTEIAAISERRSQEEQKNGAET